MVAKWKRERPKEAPHLFAPVKSLSDSQLQDTIADSRYLYVRAIENAQEVFERLSAAKAEVRRRAATKSKGGAK